MDTLLYDLSIPAISRLQGSLAGQADFMQLMSTVFDPKYAFLIYSPLAYLLDPQVGRKLIMTTVVAEWLNQILKWFLHGERPYWYVHSSGHFDAQQTPIKQFPITCELGPGHPSGHAMVTAAVWYVILSALHQAYHNYQAAMELEPQGGQIHHNARATGSSRPLERIDEEDQVSWRPVVSKRLSAFAIWSIYLGLLLIVSVSRVFLGCHFPHQCLAGAALGLLVARWISNRNIQAMHYIAASAILFTTAFGTFGLLQLLGLDPSWTIKLATTHCIKREYIHLDTAPFFSIMRYCGFALGSGLGLLMPLKGYAKQLVPAEGEILITDDKAEKESPLSSRNLSWLSFKLIMALIMARLVDNLGLFVSHTNLNLFYSCAFLAYTLFSFAFINL